jgi:hypothetical protein
MLHTQMLLVLLYLPLLLHTKLLLPQHLLRK